MKFAIKINIDLRADRRQYKRTVQHKYNQYQFIIPRNCAQRYYKASGIGQDIT